MIRLWPTGFALRIQHGLAPSVGGVSERRHPPARSVPDAYDTPSESPWMGGPYRRPFVPLTP